MTKYPTGALQTKDRFKEIWSLLAEMSKALKIKVPTPAAVREKAPSYIQHVMKTVLHCQFLLLRIRKRRVARYHDDLQSSKQARPFHPGYQGLSSYKTRSPCD